jgi:uncharacterized tellurite resistance protein B-like protein
MRGRVGLALVIAISIWCFGEQSGAAERLPQVGEVQRALAERGYDVGGIDGRWGKKSERALQAFQSANGLPPTGILDAVTARKLVPKRADLRAEMARKPEDRRESVLGRSTAEMVTLYRLARTGIGSCRPGRFDLSKIQEGVRAIFGERSAELDRIVEGAADREVTGLLFLDDGFRARICDDWVATARSSGFVSDPPPVAALSSPPPPEPKVAHRAITSVEPAEPRSSVAPPPESSPTGSDSSAARGGSSAASAWVAFGTLSSLAAFILWRRARRSSATPPALTASTAAAVGEGGRPLSSSRGTESTPTSSSDLSTRVAAHNLAVVEAIRGRTSASSVVACSLPPVEFAPPDFIAPQEASGHSKATLLERMAAHNRAIAEAIRMRREETDAARNHAEPLRPVEPILPIQPEPSACAIPPSDALPELVEPVSSDIIATPDASEHSEPMLSERITAQDRTIVEVVQTEDAETDAAPILSEPLHPIEPILPIEPEPHPGATSPSDALPELVELVPSGIIISPDASIHSEPTLSERMAAHDRAIAEAIRMRGEETDAARIPAEQLRPVEPILPIEPEPSASAIPPSDALPGGSSISDHVATRNLAAVEMARARVLTTDTKVFSPAPTIPRSAPDPISPITEPSATNPAWYPGMAPRVRSDWVPRGTAVTVAGLTIPGGLIWVGSSLPCRNDRSRNENCLIDPKLTVASKRDLSGQYMPYWPSYSEIHPSSRRAYLDWLVGPRDDPSTYIGYVFLYFYGLERRLLFDEAADDRDVIRGEVERLLTVYGDNHSFRRYASDLLSADTVRRRGADVEPVFDPDIAGYEIPLDVKIALGTRVRDGRSIEPDLLLAFVRTHPETRLRTPARRAAAELRDLFVAEVEKRFPKGVKVGGASRIRKLSVTYKAASGTFEVDLLPKSLGLPDITGLAEPVGAARAILDECTSRLDAYSRDLGKSPGLTPSLAIFGKLPLEIRLDRVAELPGDPLGALRTLVETRAPITVRDLGERIGLPGNGSIDKGRLREWSTLLAGLGYGFTSDPAWTLRAAKAETPAVVFPLSAPSEAPLAPSEGYRHAQITVALAMMVALADGVVEPSEQRALAELIDRSGGLPTDERRRLTAETRVQAADPHSLSELKVRLKTLPAEIRARLADEIVTVAGADGVVDPREVALLEKLFRQIDIDERTLYARLHGGVASGGSRAAEGNAPTPISVLVPQPPASASTTTTIDLGRLAAIRHETAGITSVLSEIFAEDEPMEIPPIVEPDVEAPDDEGSLDGLDRRHRSLVVEIVERAEWAKDDFDRLVRSVGLMPGAVIETLNDWAWERFDECLLEGDDPIIANAHLLPRDLLRVTA